jgi:hypothetical protein
MGITSGFTMEAIGRERAGTPIFGGGGRRGILRDVKSGRKVFKMPKS